MVPVLVLLRLIGDANEAPVEFCHAFASDAREHLLNVVQVASNGEAVVLSSALPPSASFSTPHLFAMVDDKIVLLRANGSMLSGGVVTVAPGALLAEPFAFALPHAIVKPALTAWGENRMLLTYESFDAQFAVATIHARLVALDGTVLTAAPAEGDAGTAEATDAGRLVKSDCLRKARGTQRAHAEVNTFGAQTKSIQEGAQRLAVMLVFVHPGELDACEASGRDTLQGCVDVLDAIVAHRPELQADRNYLPQRLARRSQRAAHGGEAPPSR